jgi:aspartyl-tRNA(Asn)/glutamyl-tRNA(Gln) amidotransferase subunit B
VKEAKTFSMRTKEEAQDYRYFPEPDLPPFVIKQDKIEEIRKTIPELPQEKTLRFMKDYGLSKYDAKILVFSKKDADYAQECIEAYSNENKKSIVNFLIGPMLSEANNRNCNLSDLKVAAEQLVELLDFVDRDEITNLTAKAVLKEMIDTGKPAPIIIQDKNLIQISDIQSLETQVEEAIKENAKSVQDYKSGKNNALMFLVGQVMRKSAGRANPKIVQDILKRRLNDA